MRAAFLLARRKEDPPSAKTVASFAERAMARDGWAVWLQDIAAGRQTNSEDIARAFASTDIQKIRKAAWASAVGYGANSELLNLLRLEDPAVLSSALLAVAEFVTQGNFKAAQKASLECRRECVTVLNHVSLRLRHPDLHVRRIAAVVMAEHCQPDLLFMHQQGLKDPDWFVRFATLKALSALDARQARNLIRTTQGMPPYEQSQWVKRLLNQIEERAASADGK